MLVGFSGASCSGKTTLVKQVHKELTEMGYNVGKIEEVARWVYNKHFSKHGSLDDLRMNKDLYLKFQLMIYKRQLYLENKLNREFEVVLTDRTIFDNLLYTITYCDGETLLKVFKSLPQVSKNRYKLIFLCEPVNAKRCMDGFRSPNDIKLREMHTRILYNWMRGWDNVIPLTNSMDFWDRVNLAIEKIRRVCYGDLL